MYAKSILPIKNIVRAVENGYNFKLYPLSRKKIFFVNSYNNFCLCSPSSKFHKTINGYWVDITLKQKKLLQSFEKSLIVFRLEGGKIFFIKWETLSPLLTAQAQQYNSHELEHWKLYIYNSYIRVGKTNAQVSGKIQTLEN